MRADRGDDHRIVTFNRACIQTQVLDSLVPPVLDGNVELHEAEIVPIKNRFPYRKLPSFASTAKGGRHKGAGNHRCAH